MDKLTDQPCVLLVPAKQLSGKTAYRLAFVSRFNLLEDVDADPACIDAIRNGVIDLR